MTEESDTAVSIPSAIDSIAIVDDDFAPLTAGQLVDDNSQLLTLAGVLDEAGQTDFEQRGFDANALSSAPDQAIDALTDPTRPLARPIHEGRL